MKSGTTDLIQKILTAGEGMIRDGSFLITSSDMIEDQKGWCDEDPAKDMDFSTSSFWITTDDGAEPVGIDDDAELNEIFSSIMITEEQSSDYSEPEDMEPEDRTELFVYFKNAVIGETPPGLNLRKLVGRLSGLSEDRCIVVRYTPYEE